MGDWDCKNCGTAYSVDESADPLYHDYVVEDGLMVPANPTSYSQYVPVVVPESPEDPAHYGHLVWQCCRILKAAAAVEK